MSEVESRQEVGQLPIPGKRVSAEELSRSDQPVAVAVAVGDCLGY